MIKMIEQAVMGLGDAYTGPSVTSLPEVTDPEKTYADITRSDYENYVRDFRQFEEGLLEDAQTDTSLIDKASVDAQNQTRIAREIQQRNIERYGGAGLTAVQRQEQAKALSLGASTNLSGMLNNARIQQDQLNRSTLADLINIGQGVNRTAISGLGDAPAMAAKKKSAYNNAKAAHKSQMIGLGGSLASAALLAFAI